MIQKSQKRYPSESEHIEVSEFEDVKVSESEKAGSEMVSAAVIYDSQYGRCGSLVMLNKNVAKQAYADGLVDLSEAAVKSLKKQK